MLVPMRRCQLTTYRFMRFGKAHDQLSELEQLNQ